MKIEETSTRRSLEILRRNVAELAGIVERLASTVDPYERQKEQRQASALRRHLEQWTSSTIVDS
jgi:hypothetical protein